MRPLPVLVILFSLLFSLQRAGFASCQSLSSAAERAALYSLRSTLGLRARDWPRRADPCSEWTGVGCLSGRVVSLNLSGLHRTKLARHSPRFAVDGLQNLTHLVSFNASGFLLPGPIPDWFGRRFLSSLATLDLSSAAISGDIPPFLGALSNLNTLILSNNNLTGSIPPQLGNLSVLVSLDLSFNSLSGDIPPALGALSNLKNLILSNNNLTGSITQLGNANANASGGVFNLSNNLFYGSISSGFGILFQRFKIVDLSNNYFEGTAPVSDWRTEVIYAVNCFRNAANQKSTSKCEKFYMERGISYDISVAKSNRNWRYILGGVLGGLAFVLVLASMFVLLVRRRANSAKKKSVHDSGPSSVGVTPELPSSAVSVKFSAVGDAFTYEQLLRATSEFSPLKLVKHGHSGDLYYGVLEDGTSVVVKRINVQTLIREAYALELNLFSKVSHDRLVPFVGHCVEREDEKLLVYKHMPNRDLSTALYRKPLMEEGLQSLDWIKRLKIAIGVAEALCFLHHECTPALVHRDVQASSILLDDKYEVHLGSLSEVCAQQGDGQHKALTRILRTSQTSEQGVSGSPTATCSYDVYCFGKVLLELVTGKLGISGSDSAAMKQWLDHMLTHINFHEREQVTKIMDPTLVVDEDHLEEVRAMAIVAKSCLNPKPSKRPLARYILNALENPVKVVREESYLNSSRLRTTSSLASWRNALFGSWRRSSSDLVAVSGPMREDRSLKYSTTGRSQESGGDCSFSCRKTSREIFPEPSGLVEELDEQ